MNCNYKLGKLKPFIYLIRDLLYKEVDYKVYIVGGQITKLNLNNVSFNEEESSKNRFKFNTSVTGTIDRLIDDTFIRSNQFKIVVEDQEGIQYLVSPEFNAKYTSSLTLNQGGITQQFIFNTQSNINTKILDTKIVSKAIDQVCEYSPIGIKDVYYKTNQWIKFNWLSCEYQKTFNGNQIDIQCTVTIPVEDNNLHYELIKNRQSLKIELLDQFIIEDDLIVSYTRQTSQTNDPDLFTLTFKKSTNSDLIGITKSNKQLRWIDTSDYICDGLSKYIKQSEQISTDGTNWTNTGQYRKGYLIQSNSVDCGYITLSRWIETDEYLCIGLNAYIKEKEQIQVNDVWQDTGKYRAGRLYEINSDECGYSVIEWIPEGYICEEYNEEITWKLIPDEYICSEVL